MQDQGLSGYSSAPLTSSAPLRLGKCRLSWVGLGYALRPSGAAATDTPRLASSRYRLARLRADRTLPVHLCFEAICCSCCCCSTGNWLVLLNANQSHFFDSWSTTPSQPMHSFLLKEEEEPPVCVACNTIITVNHIFIEYADLAEVRKKYSEIFVFTVPKCEPETVFDDRERTGVFIRVWGVLKKCFVKK